jgi:hypothetical protein
MSRQIPFHEKAYVCIHVFADERPVLLVSRPDGDWCFLCGDEHDDDASDYRVMGIGHVLERDQTLHEVADLRADWEAERTAVGAEWRRVEIPEDDNFQEVPPKEEVPGSSEVT